MQLKNYQQNGVVSLCQDKNWLLADEPGLGKTIQCIELIKKTPGRILVVCPLSLKHNWLYECLIWGLEEEDIQVVPSQENKGVKVNIINYDRLDAYLPKLMSVNWSLLI